jgi:hypothetical protein
MDLVQMWRSPRTFLVHIIGFKIADIYPELFTFEKGDKKGQLGVSIKGRLLRVKFAKVNGEAVDLPEPAPVSESDTVAA